jgi:hypothetical protein
MGINCEVGIPVTSDVKELNVTCLRCTDNLTEVKVRYNLPSQKKNVKLKSSRGARISILNSLKRPQQL